MEAQGVCKGPKQRSAALAGLQLVLEGSVAGVVQSLLVLESTDKVWQGQVVVFA